MNEPVSAPSGMVRVAVDAMGGDHAPAEIVLGAVEYARLAEGGTLAPAQIILVGDKERIAAELTAALNGASAPTMISIHHTSQEVAMDEHPTDALKKTDSSLVVANALVKQGLADAAFSAGNTGAMLVAAIQVIGRIDGVRRPPIATLLPTRTGRRYVLVDGGANLGSRPSFLMQFAVLGSMYAELVLGYENPRVGLLSNGEEDSKGDELTVETNALMRAKGTEYGINFVGNVEPHYAVAGVADVVVCDGFVGNILLKSVEGIGELTMGILRKAIGETPDSAGREALQGAYNTIASGIDYAEAGGAPLLGVNGVAMIAHGRSNARAIRNGIRQCVLSAQSPYLARVREAFAALKSREAAP